jgi:hypothetical protein
MGPFRTRSAIAAGCFGLAGAPLPQDQGWRGSVRFGATHRHRIGGQHRHVAIAIGRPEDTNRAVWIIRYSPAQPGTRPVDATIRGYFSVEVQYMSLIKIYFL